MCATALEQPDAQIETAAQASKAGADSGSKQKEEAKNPVDSQTIFCPDCQAENELGWSFCQQCGHRLPQVPPQPPPPPPPASEPKPPLGVKTVASEPSPTEPTGRSMKTVEEESPAVAATVVADPTLPKRPSPPVQPPPPPPKPAPPPPVEKAPPPPPPASPMTEVVKSEPANRPVGTIPCPQCGHQNDPTSAFCSSCGAVLTVAQTIVMSSVAAPPKGRLHLVMEGGQAGEVYDLSDETIIGRTQGEITFPHDGFMSGRHAKVERRGGSFLLTDEGSRNGTFIKLKGEVELKPGDMILVGKQLFRFERE